MTTTGRCLCGAIQFEFAGEAVETAHWHCENCGRQTSSPVATLVTVHDPALRITRGLDGRAHGPSRNQTGDGYVHT